ncbi:MAG: hypothetical protein U5J62_02505 [Desulfurivibrio sp.]|nr:hypothetical protein [Desulfurivibrio sp.]
MTKRHVKQTGFAHFPLLLLLSLLTLSLLAGGCTAGNGWGSGARDESDPAKKQAPPQPYHISGLEDLRIPSELDFDRENSMVVQTESFAGGVLQFRGRVETNSLSDFFTTTMPRQGWKLAGSVKHKNIMLAFAKPYKTCTIIINEGELSQKATVRIYLTEDLAAINNGGSNGGNGASEQGEAVPFSF